MADGAEGRKGAEATPISRDRLWLVVYDLVGGGLHLLCLVCLLSAVLAAGPLSTVLLVTLGAVLLVALGTILAAGLLSAVLLVALSTILAAGLLGAVLLVALGTVHLVALSGFLGLSVLAGLLAVLLTGRASLAVTALSTRATAGLRGFLLLRCLGGYTDAKRKGAGTSQNKLLHYRLKVNR